MKLDRKYGDEAGFTIVELMIATVVFSVILLTITYGVIYFSQHYYKGISSSSTQVTAQSATDAITQAIQFSSGPSVTATTAGNSGFFCAGTKLFLYTLGEKYAGNPATTRGLYEMDKPSGPCASSAPANGIELLGQGMRLTDIVIGQVNLTNPDGTWSVSIHIANADDDLLCNNTPAATVGKCATGSPIFSSPTQVVGDKIACKSTTGSQFCSVASSSTVAQQRIVN